ncbi:uncharacterized protein LOC127793914 [Diospyros lotus]|uniref:uncharacterized protein LOC127793914 n=1 Tax=Diospyros lotus TaxID=55363 RepID=UPI00225965F7|nr:uncharacterized protein LOC127793914 [Diospyros lotus]
MCFKIPKQSFETFIKISKRNIFVHNKKIYYNTNYLAWNLVPKSNMDELWEIIESKFTFEPHLTEVAKKSITKDMHENLIRWDCEIKCKCSDKDMTAEQMVACMDDPLVNKDQFNGLVRHWCSDEEGKLAPVNESFFGGKRYSWFLIAALLQNQTTAWHCSNASS